MTDEATPKRVAVVTGGTGALGGAVVAALLRDGWSVHVPWREPGPARALERSVAGPRADLALHKADVTDPDGVERLFRAVDAAAGRLDALVNLAGGFAMGPLAEVSPDQWHRMFATNATSAFLCCRAAAPRLTAAGGGRIVSVAAAAALDPKPGMVAYVAAKIGRAHL